MDHSSLDDLLEAARLAPSGDNTQPWQFQLLRGARTIRIVLDPARDASPMNAGQRMARIALGAALENMIQTAKLNDWRHETTIAEDSITFLLGGDYPRGKLADPLRNRTSNRKKYNPTTISGETVGQLRQAMAPNESRALWIVDAEARTDVTQLVGQADSIILSSQPVRRAFLEKVRFDCPVSAVVDEGLSLGCLEISPFQRAALRIMKWIPDGVLRIMGGPTLFRQAAMDLANSAAGFCAIVSDERGTRQDVEVGRLFQRAWLALTAQGFHAQPMMSLLVLRNMIDHGFPAPKHTIDQGKSQAVLDKFQELLGRIGGEKSPATACALLRFGAAEPPTVRTGRLPLERLVVENDDARA